LEELREKNEGVPVILFSDKPNLDNVLKAYHLGIFDYLKESCSDEEVLAVVRLALEKHELQCEKERLIQDLIEANGQLSNVERPRNRRDITVKPSFDPHQLLSKCLNLTMDFFEAKKGVALIVNPKTHSLFVKESIGCKDYFSKGSSFDITGTPELKTVVEDGKPCLLTSVEGRLVCAPVGVPPNVFGVICLGRERDFSESELNVLSIFSPLLPYALQGNRVNTELEASRTGGVLSLLLLLEEKDPELWEHATRVMEYSSTLAKSIIGLSTETIQSIRFAALLHDIGKIAETTSIRERIQEMTSRVIEPLTLSEETKKILLHQAERFDGNGEPHSLRGEEIPIGARILAIANAFDEAISEGKSKEEVLRGLTEHAGTRFDPLMVEHFTQLMGPNDKLAGFNKFVRSLNTKKISRTLEDPSTKSFHAYL
jgi:response regulator RpfG family c-di-GMP phosphodiesterase